MIVFAVQDELGGKWEYDLPTSAETMLRDFGNATMAEVHFPVHVLDGELLRFGFRRVSDVVSDTFPLFDESEIDDGDEDDTDDDDWDSSE